MLKLVRIFFGHPRTLGPTSLCPIYWHNILFVFICTGPRHIVANHFPNSWRIINQLDVNCYFDFSSYILNIFRTLICPSSGVCDYVVEIPHWLISFLVCSVLNLGCGSARVVSGLPAKAGSPDTTLAEPHPKFNTEQTKNEINQCGISTT